jgi:hypothetical protein
VRTVNQILEHHGVKGMHWGSRKGTHGRVSVDARKAHAVKDKAKTHGHVKALTDNELRKFNKRMELEQKFTKLSTEQKKVDKGHDFVKAALGVGVTVNSVIAFSNSSAGKFLKENFKKTPKGKHFAK